VVEAVEAAEIVGVEVEAEQVVLELELDYL
jgi:hypothetical protein